MDFDDSFFEDSDECEEDNSTSTEKVLYTVKRCESEWFLQDTVEGARDSEGHTLLKYRADFLYHRKQYSAAVAMYNHILKVLPATNALVRREVTDSLARCQLHLGEYNEALAYAKSLVLPPHCRDSSSWQLIAQCHQQLGNIEDSVLALQKSAMLQRYHISYWLQLSDSYRILRSDGDGDNSTAVYSEQVTLILHNTVALFKPYFRWKKFRVTQPNVASERHNGCCLQGAELKDKPHHGCPTVKESNASGGDIHSLGVCTGDGGVQSQSVVVSAEKTASSNSVEGKVVSSTSSCYTSGNQRYGDVKSGNHGNHQCKVDSCMNGTSYSCNHGNSGSGTSSTSGCVHVAPGSEWRPSVPAVEGHFTHTGCCVDAVPGDKQQASVTVNFTYTGSCEDSRSTCSCSCFSLLVGGKMAAEDFLSQLRELPLETARESLDSLYTMASYSCLIWARQLLRYSFRYSASFARQTQQRELERVEQLLNGYHGNTMQFLLDHFSQTSIFEDFSDRN